MSLTHLAAELYWIAKDGTRTHAIEQIQKRLETLLAAERETPAEYDPTIACPRCDHEFERP